MYRDIKNWIRTCVACQSSKIQRHTVTPLSSFSTPDNRFSKLHLNLVSPLPVSQGYMYLLSLIVLLSGQRPFLSVRLQLKKWQKLYLQTGFLGLAYQLLSLQIKVANSNLFSGLTYLKS